MKNPWEWEEEDVELLIQDGVQESLTLDYKRCGALEKNDKSKKNLSKDVSAFANSAGGVILYGVIETNHLPTAIDIGYDPTDITREWLEQVINSTIQRRIDGIRIKQIELKNSNPGRVIYVVNIPQSKYAPHMAMDHIFYKRFNYQSIPMEEYEVRDVTNRADAPNLILNLYLDSESINLEFEENQDFSKPISLTALVINESAIPAMYYVVRICVDKDLKVVYHNDFLLGSDIELPVGNATINTNSYSQNYGIPSKMPIWQGISFKIFAPDFKVAIPKLNNNVDYILGCLVNAPGMQEKLRLYVLSIRENQARLLSIEIE